MKYCRIQRTGVSIAIGMLTLLFAISHPARAAEQTESALSIPHAQLLQPEELDHMLQGEVADKPLVLQVGSHILFAEAHIPASEYAGPGSQPESLQLLQSRVSSLPRNRFIVLYCGCCPWNRCPNVGPAFKQLHDMGFSNVKVLYLADNFGTNWVKKGYRVERGR